MAQMDGGQATSNAIIAMIPSGERCIVLGTKESIRQRLDYVERSHALFLLSHADF
jgi:hypothetical protein